jgi:hypothetical protein
MSTRTHRSLQSARDIAEKEKRGGAADGAGGLLSWGKVEEEGEEEGEMGAPTLD